MERFYLPLSGDVQQTINPWSWATQVGTGQIGLFNINLGRSSNPALERRILDDVGSYGRQIGQLGDALAAVLDHLPTDGWNDEAREAVRAFRCQMAAVRKIKEKDARGR